MRWSFTQPNQPRNMPRVSCTPGSVGADAPAQSGTRAYAIISRACRGLGRRQTKLLGGAALPAVSVEEFARGADANLLSTETALNALLGSCHATKDADDDRTLVMCRGENRTKRKGKTQNEFKLVPRTGS